MANKPKVQVHHATGHNFLKVWPERHCGKRCKVNRKREGTGRPVLLRVTQERHKKRLGKICN